MRDVIAFALGFAMAAKLGAAAPTIRPAEPPWDNSLPAVTEWGRLFSVNERSEGEID